MDSIFSSLPTDFPPAPAEPAGDLLIKQALAALLRAEAARVEREAFPLVSVAAAPAPTVVERVETVTVESPALLEKVAEMAALLERGNVELRAARTNSEGMIGQIARLRQLVKSLEERARPLGPFEPPQYELSVLGHSADGRIAEVRMSPIISGALAEAVKQGKLPMPPSHSMVVSSRDGTGRPRSVRLKKE